MLPADIVDFGMLPVLEYDQPKHFRVTAMNNGLNLLGSGGEWGWKCLSIF